MDESLRVVKVGGSLYDLPDLGPRLRTWIGQTRTLLVPGGGPTADVIRTLDSVHRLGDETAHWLALRALSVNAHFLARLLPEATVVPRPPMSAGVPEVWILDPFAFCQEDDRRVGALPHTWQVTSDSIAVRVAACAEAAELVLLKSASPRPDGGWDGLVDEYFAEALRQAPTLRVRVINFRAT